MHLRASILWLAALLCAFAVAASEPVSPRQLSQALQSQHPPLVIDVRTQAEFDAGHIPGAVLIPHDQLAQRLDEVPADREVVVYCHSGHRATLAERLLTDHQRSVRQLDGSWIAWREAGLPVEPTEPTEPTKQMP
ncbi:MAG: rhodanese-like domain-containing protein [Porticoccaceae bacterium]